MNKLEQLFSACTLQEFKPGKWTAHNERERLVYGIFQQGGYYFITAPSLVEHSELVDDITQHGGAVLDDTGRPLAGSLIVADLTHYRE